MDISRLVALLLVGGACVSGAQPTQLAWRSREAVQLNESFIGGPPPLPSKLACVTCSTDLLFFGITYHTD